MSSTRVHVTVNDQLVFFRDGEQTLEDNFRRFHRENPHVYRVLVKLAREWARATMGAPCGMRMLFERARWELHVTGDGEPLALNNNYCPFYARLIMERESDLVGAFELRRQRFDRPEVEA